MMEDGIERNQRRWTLPLACLALLFLCLRRFSVMIMIQETDPSSFYSSVTLRMTSDSSFRTTCLKPSVVCASSSYSLMRSIMKSRYTASGQIMRTILRESHRRITEAKRAVEGIVSSYYDYLELLSQGSLLTPSLQSTTLSCLSLHFCCRTVYIRLFPSFLPSLHYRSDRVSF